MSWQNFNLFDFSPSTEACPAKPDPTLRENRLELFILTKVARFSASDYKTILMNNMISKIDLARFEKLYDGFDKGHDRYHMKRVRDLAVSLAKKYCPNQVELAYIAATLHDIGLSKSREDHEINGAKMVEKDEELNRVLAKEEIKEIVHAVKEHRATTGNPKTILAKVLSDADRTSDTTVQALKRAFEHGKNHFPDLSENEQIMRSAKHLIEKYGPDGHGRRVYFPESESKLDKKIAPIVKLVVANDIKKLKELMASKNN